MNNASKPCRFFLISFTSTKKHTHDFKSPILDNRNNFFWTVVWSLYECLSKLIEVHFLTLWNRGWQKASKSTEVFCRLVLTALDKSGTIIKLCVMPYFRRKSMYFSKNNYFLSLTWAKFFRISHTFSLWTNRRHHKKTCLFFVKHEQAGLHFWKFQFILGCSVENYEKSDTRQKKRIKQIFTLCLCKIIYSKGWGWMKNGGGQHFLINFTRGRFFCKHQQFI